MFGQANQRASISRPRNGTHRLTIAIATIVPTRKRTAIRRAQSLELAGGLHHAPGGAEKPVAEDRAPTPVIRLKGVRKSKVPPVKARPLLAKPCTKAPSTTPCAKVATSEP